MVLACLCGGAGLALAAVLARPPVAKLREELARILAQREYQQAEAPWLRKLLQRIVEWLSDLFGAWSPQVHALKEAWPALYWVIVFLLVAVLALLLYHIALTLRMAFAGPRRRQEAPVSVRQVSPDALRARAESMAKQGRYLEAIRALLEALMRRLDRLEVTPYDPSRTNWELLEALAAAPVIAREFEPLARRLDLVLYGGAVADAETFRICAEQVDRIWTAGEGSA
ncbi:MAG: DUF4129 domain-containing protein [Armatimonadia bacterium]